MDVLGTEIGKQIISYIQDILNSHAEYLKKIKRKPWVVSTDWDGRGRGFTVWYDTTFASTPDSWIFNGSTACFDVVYGPETSTMIRVVLCHDGKLRGIFYDFYETKQPEYIEAKQLNLSSKDVAKFACEMQLAADNVPKWANDIVVTFVLDYRQLESDSDFNLLNNVYLKPHDYTISLATLHDKVVKYQHDYPANPNISCL